MSQLKRKEAKDEDLKGNLLRNELERNDEDSFDKKDEVSGNFKEMNSKNNNLENSKLNIHGKSSQGFFQNKFGEQYSNYPIKYQQSNMSMFQNSVTNLSRGIEKIGNELNEDFEKIENLIEETIIEINKENFK